MLVRGMLIGSSVTATKAVAGSLLGEARRRFVLLGEGVAGLSEGFAQRVAAFSSSGAVPRGVGAAPIFFYALNQFQRRRCRTGACRRALI